MNNNKMWCQKLQKFWQQKEIDKIIELFSENVIYYEEPNNKITYKELKFVWSEIKNQNIVSLNFKILSEENNKCIANFILKENTTIDMIYEITLNDENKCTYFKQWYMEY